MIIFTTDETPFRSDREIIMSGTLDTIPSDKDTTYILYSDKFSSQDVLDWSPFVTNKLVIVTHKAPSLTKKANELCVVDEKLKDKSNDDTFRLVKALMNWSDRERVKKLWNAPPIPLLNWFLLGNEDDIDFWRRIAKVRFTLPEKYLEASTIYGITPSRKRVVWPKRKGKSKERPVIFKSTDEHWEILIDKSISVANSVRDADDVPSGMRKRKAASQKWI